MADKVYFRGSRATARLLALRLSLMLSGRAPDHLGIARGVFLTLGFAALDSIKQDFVVKSRGGTGVDGVKWPPLSKEYLAYGRRFRAAGEGRPSEKAELKAAYGLDADHRFGIGHRRAMLSDDQKKAMKKLTEKNLERLSLSLPIEQARKEAKSRAWATIKRQIAGTEIAERIARHTKATKLEVYGNRKVDILRDIGVLLNSLSPGRLDNPGPNATYTPPPQNETPKNSDGSTPSWWTGDHQIFDLQTSGVIVGTNVPYAAYHQDGKRPFLPKDQIPDVWEQKWLDYGTQALAIGARMMYEGAA